MVICAVWVVEGRVVSPMVHIGMHGDDCYKYAQHFSLTALSCRIWASSVWRLHAEIPCCNSTVLSEVFIEI